MLAWYLTCFHLSWWTLSKLCLQTCIHWEKGKQQQLTVLSNIAQGNIRVKEASVMKQSKVQYTWNECKEVINLIGQSSFHLFLSLFLFHSLWCLIFSIFFPLSCCLLLTLVSISRKWPVYSAQVKLTVKVTGEEEEKVNTILPSYESTWRNQVFFNVIVTCCVYVTFNSLKCTQVWMSERLCSHVSSLMRHANFHWFSTWILFFLPLYL